VVVQSTPSRPAAVLGDRRKLRGPRRALRPWGARTVPRTLGRPLIGHIQPKAVMGHCGLVESDLSYSGMSLAPMGWAWRIDDLISMRPTVPPAVTDDLAGLERPP